MRTRRVDLGGSAWQFRRTDGDSSGDWAPAAVPGCVQTDLMALGRLEDPFVGTNEDRVQWVGAARWAYRRTFVAEALPRGAQAYLVFDGLDTFATVTLNGRAVGTADNMFMPWRFEVTDSLAAGENELVVAFDSTEARAKAAADAYGTPLKNCARAVNAPFVRKPACHFGWDWGPTVLTVGIWRPVRLEIVSRAWLSDVDAWGEPADGTAGRLFAAIEVAGPKTEGLTLSVAATAPDGKTPVGQAEVPVTGGHAAATIDVPNADLWWPNGLGGQPLYTLRLRLMAGRRVVDERRVRVGIRRLELVQEPDAYGRSFFFRVNGAPLFAKGANWIPADTFPARVTPALYRDLVASCAAVNMNMLRIWGGGYYEDEVFYDLCDEYGLLVWQDFMYACALYPGDDPAFAANIGAEAEAAIRQLRRHTCLALWCGNNEMESGWFEWGWDKQHPAAVYAAYERIFHDILPKAAAALDPRRAYIRSSPTSWEVGKPNDPASGDTHFWGVWHGQGSHLNYLDSTHRFVSEFGYQSIPSLETMGPVIPAEERRLESPAMLQHQKSGGGNEKIGKATTLWLGQPKDFESLIYLSQVYQALAIRTGVEHWRRLAPRTMGTLYWQANDCWPVMSWASLDFHGRWKALHYAARRFNQPYLVSGLADETSARVWYTADPAAEAARGDLAWQVRTWDGRVLKEGRSPVALTPGETPPPVEVRWADIAGATPEAAYLAAELSLGGTAVGRTILAPLPLSKVALPDPGLTVKIRARGHSAEVTVAAKAVALSVSLEAPGTAGRFDDNFFDLLPGEKRTVRLLAAAPLGKEGVAALAAGLKVLTVYNARVFG